MKNETRSVVYLFLQHITNGNGAVETWLFAELSLNFGASFAHVIVLELDSVSGRNQLVRIAGQVLDGDREQEGQYSRR